MQLQGFFPAALSACAAAFRVSAPSRVAPATRAASLGQASMLSRDGAWNWYTDPRASCSRGSLYAGWVTSDGRIEVGQLRLADGRWTTATLASEFEADDHNNPSLFITRDGRVTAFYSRHSCPGERTRYRVTATPGSIEAWTDEADLGTNTSLPPDAGDTSLRDYGATYSHAVPTPGRDDEVSLFWRGGDFLPTFSLGSYDRFEQAWAWTPAQTLVTASGIDRAGRPRRPYAKHRSNGVDRIGTVFGDGHPDQCSCNIYYAAIGRDDSGQPCYLRADGGVIKPLSAGPLDPSRGEAEKVFDCTRQPFATGDNSWAWDLAFDGPDHPVIVYVTYRSRGWRGRGDCGQLQHQYRWARWDGRRWIDRLLVSDSGGSPADVSIGDPQYFYSGGVTLDPVDPGIVYLSRTIGGQFEIEQWRTDDFGRSWQTLPITLDSGDVKNIRPVVPANRPRDTEMVLWMAGRYDYWANAGAPYYPGGAHDGKHYDTAIKLWTRPAGTRRAPGNGGALA